MKLKTLFITLTIIFYVGCNDTNSKKEPKYIVVVEDGPYRGRYGCDKEPKSFGNGIRFTIFGTETEIIVTGNFSITKIN
jgi:hypothetical protein